MKEFYYYVKMVVLAMVLFALGCLASVYLTKLFLPLIFEQLK